MLKYEYWLPDILIYICMYIYIIWLQSNERIHALKVSSVLSAHLSLKRHP